jgi:Fur family transcriptional regulator, iron response regulator
MSDQLPRLPVERADIPAALTAAGITPTPQRVEIAAVLLGAAQHLCADQIIARLATARVSVSKATVYNTLGLFAARGLVREVMVDATRVFYDSNTTPHHHFYNVDDGVLTDFPSTAVVIEHLPAPPPGTAADGVEVVIRVRNTG